MNFVVRLCKNSSVLPVPRKMVDHGSLRARYVCFVRIALVLLKLFGMKFSLGRWGVTSLRFTRVGVTFHSRGANSFTRVGVNINSLCAVE